MIAVGPPSYYPLAFLKLAGAIPKDYGYFSLHPSATEIVQTIAAVFAIAIIGMVRSTFIPSPTSLSQPKTDSRPIKALFFFLMAFTCIAGAGKQMKFRLPWYGFIFPNVGLLSTIGVLALTIPSEPLGWVVSGLTAALVGLWLFVQTMHMKALVTNEPGAFL
jgi:hypothetical protein